MNQETAETIATAWHDRIWGDSPEGGNDLIEYENTWYLVTTGTGDGCFAYDVEEVDEWLAHWEIIRGSTEERPYQNFCDYAEPQTEPGLAALVRDEYDFWLCKPGICTPILDCDICEGHGRIFNVDFVEKGCPACEGSGYLERT
jgi:hypothetical protein